jgi:hypothetical protein
VCSRQRGIVAAVASRGSSEEPPRREPTSQVQAKPRPGSTAVECHLVIIPTGAGSGLQQAAACQQAYHQALHNSTTMSLPNHQLELDQVCSRLQQQHVNRRTSKSRQVPFKLRHALPTARSFTQHPSWSAAPGRHHPPAKEPALFPASPATRRLSKP